MQHQLWLLALHGRLHTLDLPENLDSVLDIGCGTGGWAMAMAAAHPSAQVVAADITPPKINPLPNLKVVESNVEKPWPFGQKFSFVHGRMLNAGIHDWPAVLSNCLENLEPGGQLELLEPANPMGAEVEAANDESSSPWIKLWNALAKSWEAQGVDYYVLEKHVERLQNLGFEDVTETKLRFPLGEWADSDRERQMGAITLKSFQAVLAMNAAKILAHHPDLDEEQVQDLLVAGRKDLAENCVAKQFYVPM